ncbi:MAG TPA: PilZ domain-containing protein [Desulfomonilaceae bacterium]|nr:PilZ domain-containing protein [Desulfomonilaceae bacterium]
MDVDNSESGESRRKFKRRYAMFKIPVYDAKTKKFVGLMQDLSEQGIQLLGIKVDVNSTMTMIVDPAGYVKGPPISFQAVCKWVREEGSQGYYVSGFEILNISNKTRDDLIDLMETATLD